MEFRRSLARASPVLRFGLGAALALAGILKVASALAEDCALSAPLTLADTQDGFAGQVGTIWTIAPDCSFSIARQLGATVGEPYRQGRFTPEQQKSFEELLSQAAIEGLPEQLGSGPIVNARRVTLSYGGKVSVLMLPPGGAN